MSSEEPPITLTEMLSGVAPSAMDDDDSDVRAGDADGDQGRDGDDAELEQYLSGYQMPDLRAKHNTGPKGVLADHREHVHRTVRASLLVCVCVCVCV